MEETDRRVLRVLRFLGRGGAVLRAAAEGGRVLLDGGERGVVGAQDEVMAWLTREGLVDVAGARVTLSATGRMAARRAAAPAEPFRAQHQDLEQEVILTPAGRETVTVNHAESPLALLWRRKAKDGSTFLSAGEFRAGERLRSDYTRGQIVPRLGVNWGSIGRGGGGRGAGDAGGIAELTDAALAARMRVEKAVSAVGPELSGVLIDVCCFLKGLEQVEAERSWPARSAKVVLKSALGALARHYEPARKPEGHMPAILHWGAEGYRPRMA